MPNSVASIVNYFLDLAAREGKTLSPMSVQKLIWFAHGWHLAVTGRPLIDGKFQAWNFGPVIPWLYHELKEYGAGAITSKLRALDFQDGKLRTVIPELGAESDLETGQAKKVLEKVWQVYGGYTPIQLSNMTHQAGTPWRELWEGTGGAIPKGTVIPDEKIREYFVSKVTGRPSEEAK